MNGGDGADRRPEPTLRCQYCQTRAPNVSPLIWMLSRTKLYTPGGLRAHIRRRHSPMAAAPKKPPVFDLPKFV